MLTVLINNLKSNINVNKLEQIKINIGHVFRISSKGFSGSWFDMNFSAKICVLSDNIGFSSDGGSSTLILPALDQVSRAGASSIGLFLKKKYIYIIQLR